MPDTLVTLTSPQPGQSSTQVRELWTSYLRARRAYHKACDDQDDRFHLASQLAPKLPASLYCEVTYDNGDRLKEPMTAASIDILESSGQLSKADADALRAELAVFHAERRAVLDSHGCAQAEVASDAAMQAYEEAEDRLAAATPQTLDDVSMKLRYLVYLEELDGRADTRALQVLRGLVKALKSGLDAVN